MTKHEAVKDFFEPKVAELVGNALGFNFAPEDTGTAAIVPQYTDRNIHEYVNGDVQREYGFAFVIVRPYSTEPIDILNLEAMDLGQAFMDWIEAQDREGSYPDFGEGCEIESMEVMQNMPNLATVNAKEGVARYMIQGRIVYREFYKE